MTDMKTLSLADKCWLLYMESYLNPRHIKKLVESFYNEDDDDEEINNIFKQILKEDNPFFIVRKYSKRIYEVFEKEYSKDQ